MENGFYERLISSISLLLLNNFVAVIFDLFLLFNDNMRFIPLFNVHCIISR